MNQHHIPNFFFFFPQVKVSCPQNLSIPTNLSMHIPTKFCHVHKTKFTRQQTFPHTSWTYSYKPTTQIFHNANALKPSQISSNNITNYQHCQNSISHQHCPSYTMIKNKNFKNAPKPTLQHDQSYNTPNSNKNTTKWQCLTIKFSMKHETTFFQAKKPKEKLTLMSMWEYGARVLGSWRSPSSSCQSNVGSYFLPWKVRKEDPLEEEDILMQRKMGLKMGSTKNGCVAKVLKKHKDLKKYWGRWMREGWKLRKVFLFLFFIFRRNGEMKKKNQMEEGE